MQSYDEKVSDGYNRNINPTHTSHAVLNVFYSHNIPQLQHLLISPVMDVAFTLPNMENIAWVRFQDI